MKTPDGVRRIAELKKGKLTWCVEVPDTSSDEDFKEIITTGFRDIPAIVDQNGGGWKLKQILSEFPHEKAERERLEAEAKTNG